ncbi:glutaredoxin domain-containing cysteine-rich protein 2 [Ambystoma mexicanum]|uniref:glutaredoxin domain-containing cysteine-rich protein 2 n=1 Tax=Ambystoma mexicanum TaxID=8296 RepID=UPI0037E81E36
MLGQRYDARPRKVRFKVSSAYSGRVLRQVYEDGQELASPEEDYPHTFIQKCFDPADHLFSGRGAPDANFYPTASLTAQRISVFRQGSSYTLAGGPSLFPEYPGNDQKSSDVLDFGKIIIYTRNLKIIRTPAEKRDTPPRQFRQKEEDSGDVAPAYTVGMEGDGVEGHRTLEDGNGPYEPSRYLPEEDAVHRCSQCRGSGSAPCSLCHGSKFSMLANRFKESYRALRCPACNENGLQPCQTCTV